MREQLRHLVDASELPNVEVRIHPLDWDHPPLATGAFSYMRFPQVHDVPLHDIVSVELHEGTFDIEEEDDTYKYWVAFEYLLRRSLDPEQSRSLISAIASDVWT